MHELAQALLAGHVDSGRELVEQEHVGRAEERERDEQALELFKTAYRLAPKRPIPPPLIVERVA